MTPTYITGHFKAITIFATSMPKTTRETEDRGQRTDDSKSIRKLENWRIRELV
jgi:hypothetical protein